MHILAGPEAVASNCKGHIIAPGMTENSRNHGNVPGPSKTSLFWTFQTAGWLAYGLAMFVWGREYLEPETALINKTLLILLGFLVTLGLRAIYRRTRTASSPVRFTLQLVVVSFAGAAVWREVHTLVFQAVYSQIHFGHIAVQLAAIPLGTLMYDGFVLLTWSLLYYGINDWFEMETHRERALRAEAAAHAAKLQALRAQLEPHFLFNTLNAISTLVAEGKNADAGRMIARLSDFLRLTLETTSKPEVSVAEELEFVRRYLEIEQIRFGERLKVTIDAEPDAMAALMPSLLLQPLVENAVKHGVSTRESGGSIHLSIARRNDDLQILVSDDGPGFPEETIPPRGVGLANTAARLSELYGQQSSLSLRRSEAGGVAATVAIPYRTGAA